jgi:hypothetical protein
MTASPADIARLAAPEQRLEPLTADIAVSRAEVANLIDEALATQAAEIAELRAAVRAMQSRAAPSPAVFKSLKLAAGIAQVDYANALRWCVKGLVISKKIEGRWFADPQSLAAHAALTR